MRDDTPGADIGLDLEVPETAVRARLRLRPPIWTEGALLVLVFLIAVHHWWPATPIDRAAPGGWLASVDWVRLLTVVTVGLALKYLVGPTLQARARARALARAAAKLGVPIPPERAAYLLDRARAARHPITRRPTGRELPWASLATVDGWLLFLRGDEDEWVVHLVAAREPDQPGSVPSSGGA